MQISKSDYMMFLRHPAWLWLKKHDKSKLPAISDDLQAMFDAGFVFESFAEQLFTNPNPPNSTNSLDPLTYTPRVDVGAEIVELGFDNFDEYRTLTARTKDAIDGEAKTILQARFEAGEITCISDAIVKVDDNVFDLYEIKSSTAAKPEHEYDLAFQKEVIEESGYRVNKIFVIHVNNTFVKNGEVEARDLCTIVEVTDRVNKLGNFTKLNIKDALKVVGQKECPSLSPANVKIGAFSDWLAIYKTLSDIDEYSIYHLCSPGADNIGRLEAMGARRIHDIPDDFILNDKQRRQVIATKSGEVIADKLRIKEFLKTLKFPLYFLDYETLSSVVPYFDGHSPYMQVPFQYSLHVLESPDSELKHFEYLHSDKSDPVKPLSEALKYQIGEDGTVLVWYEGFEKACNELMGRIAPEYRLFYETVNNRVVDLMVPFSTGAYVHKDFFGSASIKKVLPVLIPELSYKDLDINQGGAAQRLWMEAILDGKREDERSKILDDLLIYCGLDTLAMVKIYQFLNKL